MLYRLFTSSLLAGLLSGFLTCASALADNIRPACLEMEESDSGTIRVVWKVPRYQNIPDRFTPTFPQNCRDSSPRNRVVTGSAIIEMWNMACGEGGLAGARISIDGLEQTMTDALVRVRLADGSVHREVLRPTQRVTTIPDPASVLKKGKGALHSGFGLLDRWLSSEKAAPAKLRCWPTPG